MKAHFKSIYVGSTNQPINWGMGCEKQSSEATRHEMTKYQPSVSSSSSPTPTSRPLPPPRPVLMVKVRERENDKNGISPTGYHSNLRSPNGSPTHNRCHLYYKIRKEYRDIQTTKTHCAKQTKCARTSSAVW